jgi:hypothetical protein
MTKNKGSLQAKYANLQETTSDRILSIVFIEKTNI